MAPDGQLEWEARAGRAAALAAFGAAIFAIAPTVYLATALEESPGDVNEVLAAADRESFDFIVSSVLQAIGILLLALVLWYLYRAIKHRRPETPAVALFLLIAGPALVALIRILRQIDLISVAGDFVAMGGGTADVAEDFVREQGFGGLAEALFGANLALGLAIVLVGLYAMRTGLLSRFMGILGIIIGVLYMLPPPIGGGGGGFIQIVWFGALSLLFLDRWPGGRGPAWRTGEATPWPGAMEQRAEAGRRRTEREEWSGPERESGTAGAADDPDAERVEEPSAPAHGPSRKRRS